MMAAPGEEVLVQHCEICHFSGSEDEIKIHIGQLSHLFNYYLQGLNNKRTQLWTDRFGIKIIGTGHDVTSIGSGQYSITLKRIDYKPKKVPMDFAIQYVGQEDMFLMRCFTLHPHPYFILSEQHQSLERLKIEPNVIYAINLTFKAAPDIGIYKMPICFNFQIGDRKTFSIVREMIVNIMGLSAAVPDDANYENINHIFSGIAWHNVVREVEPQLRDQDTKEFMIPLEYMRPLESLLAIKTKTSLEDDETSRLDMIRSYLTAGLRDDFYTDFFHILLYMEELKELHSLRNYNMDSVNFVHRQYGKFGEVLQLTVPGLAEKRPSLVAGDIVRARIHEEGKRKKGCVVYMGVICKVECDVIIIDQFRPTFLDQITNDTKVDVSFCMSRLTYVRMHRAIDLCAENLLEKLFPKTPETHKNKPLQNLKFCNSDIESNPEQRQAVINIVSNTSGIAPYILFGPPGTGKTVTLVESITQVVKWTPKARILVCAPSNMACDMLTCKLSKYLSTRQLKRVHSAHRDISAIPKEILEYSNWSRDEGLLRLLVHQLLSYNVIVCTLMHAGKYAKLAAVDNDALKITHVFIDEAGQATEPESLIPLGALTTLQSQLVLAGDPKQLGPVTVCQEAHFCGLRISLLQRLMSKNELYNVEIGVRNAHYITKLVKNFRSHSDILQLSNDLFYDNELEACSDEAKTDQLVTLNVLDGTMTGRAVTFHGVSGDEEKLGSSPSFFNKKEIQVVMDYVLRLLSPKCPVKVQPSEIGIISPYIRQVYKLKTELKARRLDNEIEVGSTEAFQGREKRLMIISTVRGSSNMLWYDRKYKLGFVVDKQRLNVAITRAKSKLIVIGNPNCLMTKEKDNHWPYYINMCQGYKTLIGYKYHGREESMMKKVVDTLKQVKIDDIK